MKKLTSYFFVAAVIIIFSACKKENNNNNNNSTTDFKVRKYREVYTSASGTLSETFLLTYDANNRILTLIDSADATTKQLYSYNSNNTYSTDFFNAGAISIHEDYFLNNIPLVDSTSQYNNTGDTTLEKNIFDASNHVTQIKEYNYTTAGGAQLNGTIDYTYDVDGNIAQETDNMESTVTTYQYYTELNTVDVGLNYTPKNKNLTKKITSVSATVTTIVDLTYTFDSLHRITSETGHYSTGEITVRTYSY